MHPRLIDLALLLVAAVWGATFVMVQDAIEQLPPLAFIALRFALATLVLAALFARTPPRIARGEWSAGGAMGLFLTSGFILQTVGLQYTSASNAGFITGLYVVFAPLLAVVVLRERWTWALWLAVGLAASGLFLLANPQTVQLRGDVMMLLTALAFAGHILVSDRAVKRYDVRGLVVVQFLACTLVCGAGALARGELTLDLSKQVVIALLVTGILATAAGLLVQAYAQRHVSASRTAVILAAEAPFAGVFGYLFAGDRLGASGWLGAALTLAASILAVAVPLSRPGTPREPSRSA